jgi:hypothetical protein
MDAELGDEFLKNLRLPTDMDDPTGDDETHPNCVEQQRSDNQLDCHGDTRHQDHRGCLRALLEDEISQSHTYKDEQEFVLDWLRQTFVKDDTLVSQKKQTYDVPVSRESGHGRAGSFEERSLSDFEDWILDIGYSVLV